jgi:hypothetical protein
MEHHDHPQNKGKLQLVQSPVWKRSHKGTLAPTCGHKRSSRCVQKIGAAEKAGMLADKIGVVIDFKENEATLTKLEPKNNLNLEGQVIYFPRLYEKQMEEKEEGDIDNISLVPLNEEFNLLSGEWMKEKQNPTTKVEESEEEINQSNYFAAEDFSTVGNLGKKEGHQAEENGES